MTINKCLLFVIFLSFGFSALAQEATPEATVSADVCTVSTDQAKTVSVRVGPGENRTSYTYMPADQAFVVIGEAKAKNGTDWWKLDRTEVAPKKTDVAEAWVSQADVTADGNCDSVGEAVAPPIRPITNRPPVTTPVPSTDGTTTETTTDTQASSSQGSIAIVSGRWNARFTGFYVGCADGQAATYFSPSEIGVLSSGFSDIYDTANGISVEGYALPRIAPNQYQGSVTIEGITGTITLYVQGARSASGTIVYAETIGGLICGVSGDIVFTK